MNSKIFKYALALIAATSAWLTAAPAQASPISLRALAAQNLRLASIAYRIGTAAVGDCPAPQMMTGLLVHDLTNYDPVDRAAVSAAFHLRSGFGVLQIVPGSAADHAGLRVDDEIVSVNGTGLEDAAAATQPHKTYWRTEAFVAALQSVLAHGPARLLVRRNGNLMQLQLAGQPGCGGDIALVRSNSSNAWTDGRRVIVTTQMMRLARDDDELAFVVAHEMAHNMLGHTQRASRSIFGLGGGAKRQELAADYDAVWLMAAAGYKPEGGTSFLRTINRRFWLSFLSIDHPSIGSRMRAVASAVSSASGWAQAHRPMPLTVASLGPRQEEREQFRAALAINDSVDQVGAKAPLESDDGLLLVRHVVPKSLEREQKAGVGPVRIDQVAARTRQGEPALGQLPPRKKLAGIFLSRGSDIRMADDISAADPVTVLDVGDQRDERGDLLVGERPIAELMARIDDFDADARRIDIGHSSPARLTRVPGAVRLIDEAVNRTVFVNEIVTGNLSFGRGQPIERAFGVRHSGIMEDDHRDGQHSLVEIG